MHVNEKISPTSMPLARIDFPDLATKAPELPDLSVKKTMGDLSTLDCTEQGQKLRVKKPALEDSSDTNKREDVAPTLPQKKTKKKMPPRSKSESANAVLRRLPTHSASGRSSIMRRSKTEEEAGRPKFNRQTSCKSSISATIAEGGRPRIRRQNSRSSMSISHASDPTSCRPRTRRENSRSSVRSAALNNVNKPSGRSFSPGPGLVRQSSGRRLNRSTQKQQQQQQQDRLNRSLSGFLDAQDLSESPEDVFNQCFDRASKSCHSAVSFTDSFNSHDSGHSKNSHKSNGGGSSHTTDENKSDSKETEEEEPEWHDSFFSQDSHPSLTGSSAPPPSCDTWTCSCGTTMKDKMRFCGMCGNKKHWTCSKCDFDENISQWCFCGMCGTKKL